MSYKQSHKRVKRRPGAPRNVRRAPRNRTRPNYKLLFSVFMVTCILSCGISFALHTQSLDIATVDIKGVHLADQKVIENIAMHARGQNILLLNKHRIIANVTKVTEIKNAKMGRRYPNKVWLRVWERKAGAVITDGSKFCLIQPDGFMFHEVNGPVNGIPMIELGNKEQINLGKKLHSMAARSALSVLNSANSERIKLSKISVDPQGDICLNMGSDFYVKLGQPDDIAHKMLLLRTTLTRRPSIVRDGVYIDLSCPGATVWMPKEIAAAAP